MVQFTYTSQGFFHPVGQGFFTLSFTVFSPFYFYIIAISHVLFTFSVQITKTFYFMATGKPIPAGTADVMIKDYFDYMTKHGVDMTKQTQSVTFTGSTVMEWLVEVMPRADELRVFMGFYPEGHAQAGRTTVILWPYKDGNPATNPIEGKGGGGNDIDPFNDGAGNP